MSKAPPRKPLFGKPLFVPPVAASKSNEVGPSNLLVETPISSALQSSCTSQSGSLSQDMAINSCSPLTEEAYDARPNPSEPGWLMAMVKEDGERLKNLPSTSNHKSLDLVSKISNVVSSQDKDKPKPGEPGWLVAIANDDGGGSQLPEVCNSLDSLETQRSNNYVCNRTDVDQSSNVPRPGETGWLLAMANDCNSNTANQIEASGDKLSRNQESKDILSKRPGEPGWLSNIIGNEHLIDSRKSSFGQIETQTPSQIKPKNVSQTKSSQDSGNGQSQSACGGKEVAVAGGHVSSSQSSISSTFELLASQEVASQVSLFREEVIKNSQASVKSVENNSLSQDLEGHEELTGSVESDVPSTVTVTKDNVNSNIPSSEDCATKVASIANASVKSFDDSSMNGVASSSKVSNMLDRILGNIKSSGKVTLNVSSSLKPRNTSAEDTVPVCPESNFLHSTSSVADTLLSYDSVSINTNSEEDATIPVTSQKVVRMASTCAREYPASKSAVKLSSKSYHKGDVQQIPAKLVSTNTNLPHHNGQSVARASASSSTAKARKSSSKPIQERQISSRQNMNVPRKHRVSSKAPKKAAQLHSKLGVKRLSIKCPKSRSHGNSGLDLRAALMSLQQMRTACTWVKCSNELCGKWRYLPIKDPCEVKGNWKCSDNQDIRYNACTVAEQSWDNTFRSKWVENRFTVGSLVTAKIAGWPAWPAMVDDDPDTGIFFWIGVKDDKWEVKPSWYHVVFFDSRDKGVSRAWVTDRNVEKLKFGATVKSMTSRLTDALEMAKQAAGEDLDTRRRRYCLTSRFRGPWGADVWPGWGEYNDDDQDYSSDSEDELCKEMMKEVGRDKRSRIDLSHDEDVLDVLESVTHFGDNSRNMLKRKRSHRDDSAQKSRETKALQKNVFHSSKENTPPQENKQEARNEMNVSFESELSFDEGFKSSLSKNIVEVLSDESLKTPSKLVLPSATHKSVDESAFKETETSDSISAQQSEASMSRSFSTLKSRTPMKPIVATQPTSSKTVSIESSESSTPSDVFDARVKDTTLQVMLQTANSLTPVKQVLLTANSAAVFSKVESVVKEPALPPPASPMIRAFSIPSPNIRTPLKSSTPVGKSQLRSPCAHVSPSPGGDRKCIILSPTNEDNALNTSNGSAAFSADGSFMEI